MISKKVVRNIVKRALKEDIGKADITTKLAVPQGVKAIGVIIAKGNGILSGGIVASEVFNAVDSNIRVTFHEKDGAKLTMGMAIADIQGNAHSLLSSERVALNFLQRMSGISTLTNKYVERVKGTGTKILDTRKTTPNLRILEKYAVRIGGGFNHRMGLYDQILIKDNHIGLGGGIRNVLKKVKRLDSNKIFTEIEVQNVNQLREVLSFDVDRIMLDNMAIEDIKEAVFIVKGKCEVEVSGKVRLQNVREIAETGVNYISVGALTHSYKSIDLSMEVREIG